MMLSILRFLLFDLPKKLMSTYDKILTHPKYGYYSYRPRPERRKPRIAFFSIVLNGEPWLKLNIQHIYPYASQIFIVEGATRADGKSHYYDGDADGFCTREGHSIDDTLGVLTSLKQRDVENKIRIIKKDRPWNGKTEMCNSFLNLVDAEYLWQLDVDEFYKEEDIEKIVDYLHIHPETTCVQFYAKYFIGSFDAISVGEFGNEAGEWNRIFKFSKDVVWQRHEPPLLVDRKTRVSMDKIVLLDRRKTHSMGIYMYHYSYVTEKDIVFKERFFGTEGLTDYLRYVRRRIESKAWPVQLTFDKFRRGDVYLVEFNGVHPEPIQNDLSKLRRLELSI